MNVRYISLNFHVHDTNLIEYRYSVQVTHCLLIFPCTRITYYTKQYHICQYQCHICGERSQLMIVVWYYCTYSVRGLCPWQGSVVGR